MDSPLRPPMHGKNRAKSRYRYASESWIYTWARRDGMTESTAATREEAIEALARAKISGGDRMTLIPPGYSYDPDPNVDADVAVWIERYTAWQCPHPVTVLALADGIEVEAGATVWHPSISYILCLDCRQYLGFRHSNQSIVWLAEPIQGSPPPVRTGTTG